MMVNPVDAFFVVLGFEFTAFTLSHSTSPFCDGFFETGSLELFAWIGFKCHPPDLSPE
jgi:hypothetical protein